MNACQCIWSSITPPIPPEMPPPIPSDVPLPAGEPLPEELPPEIEDPPLPGQDRPKKAARQWH